MNNPNNGTNALGAYNTIIGGISGIALEFRSLGANPTAGTGNLTIQLMYRLWPIVPLGYN